MSVRIYYDQIKFRIRRTREIKRFLEKVVRDENRIPGDLIFILTSDDKILEINRMFLNHNYFTDVIAFDYTEGNTVAGEIYLSIQTIKKNSIEYKSGISKELLRVMIHGVLHLCGYDDKDEKTRKKMFSLQEKILIKYFRERK